jgi:hypothetical protein
MAVEAQLTPMMTQYRRIKRISNRKIKMELGYQFKYPNFRKGYSAELLRLDRAG